MRVHFDSISKIDLLEFITNNQEEFVSLKRMIEVARPLHEWKKEWHKANQAPDGKQSPEMNKKGKPRPMKSPPNPPPDIDIPQSNVKQNGITETVQQFFEVCITLNSCPDEGVRTNQAPSSPKPSVT